MRKIITLLAIPCFLLLYPPVVIARSGCCSHHGGVCGCGCCDGSPLSSTCAPYYPACSRPAPVAPIATKTPVIYTPKPTTPKPSPASIIKSTNPPAAKPEVKSATIESTPIPTVQPQKTESTITYLGVLVVTIGGLFWLIGKALIKITNTFRNRVS